MKRPDTIVKKHNKTNDTSILSVAPAHKASPPESVKSDEYISHMAAIVESSVDAIVSKSLDGIIKTWNNGGERMFGFTATEAVGRHISIIIPPEYMAEERSIMERISRNEVIDHYETVRNKKNGERLFVSITVSALRHKNNEIVGISKIARDITARKHAEIEIGKINKQLVDQNHEKELRAAEFLIANNELIHQNTEKEKRAAELVLANKELAFQNEEKEKRAAELVVANNELAFQNTEKENRASELNTANKELAFQNGEKEKRAAELYIANKELVFQNSEKEQRANELVIANKELAFQNEEKEKREHQLTIANKELAVQETKLKKHNKELEQFAYVASHDLQEPLRTVSNYMQVFAEDYVSLLDDKAMNYLNSVNNATKRMSILIKSLLEFSRLGNNSKIERVDCSVLLANVIQDLDTLVRNSKTIIEIYDMPVLNLYEVEMRQLFQNLITNAIKFQKKLTQPIISIRYTNTNGVHIFSVSDNGIGIDPCHFEHVFQIFQRLPTIEKYDGNGIGLANCKKIVQLHQGEIHIESTLNVGTTFHFTIGDLQPT